MTPETIGRYRVQGALGRGGMATVYAAHDPAFERPVAIKLLPREFLHDPQFLSRFQREAKAIAALEHPAILPVYDFGDEDGQPYLVMRLMSGGTLKERIEQGPLALEDTLFIVEQIGAALTAAHAKGVIHRDLKPGNILFDGDGNPAIADFGIVKLTEHTSQLTGSGMIGTPAYMAPEMAREGGVTTLIDIYAMGVTLYQMLTGRLPFNADTPMGVMAAHVTQPVPDVRQARPDLPGDIQTVIERAMAKEPAERYPSMDEMIDDLRAVAAGDFNPATHATPMMKPAPAARTGSTGKMSKPAAKRSGWLLIGGLGIGALAVVICGTALAAVALPELRQLAAALTPSATVSALPEATATSWPTPASLIPMLQTFGPVEVRVPGGDTFETATGSRPLDTGDAVRVGENGVALLTFASGVSVEMHPGAEMAIDRLEESGDTIFVTLTQTAGTAYHYLTPDASGLKRDYTVHTPLGTAHAVGTRFWTSERDDGWLYAPADGSIVVEVGAEDSDAADNLTAEAAEEDCLLVDAAAQVTDCDVKAEGLTPMTDGKEVTPIVTPTPTAQVYYVQPTAVPTDAPTALASEEATAGATEAPPTGCGNGVCDSGEHSYNCPADCGPPPASAPPAAYCGDRSCNNYESKCDCPQDCGSPSTACNGAIGAKRTNTLCSPPVTYLYNCVQKDECGNTCNTWTQCGGC